LALREAVEIAHRSRLLPRGAAALHARWRLEYDRDAPAPASRTHKPRFQTRKGQAWPARGDQRVNVELLSVDTFPYATHALALALGASHMHPPAEASRHSDRLDFHENKIGTDGRRVKPCARVAWRSLAPCAGLVQQVSEGMKRRRPEGACSHAPRETT
jgi:hypothetical protein